MTHIDRSIEEMDEVLVDVLNGTQRIVSHPRTSQYGPGGTGASACGLAALNCARIIFRLQEELKSYAGATTDGKSMMRAVLSQETTEDIVSICSSWPSDEHMEVKDLLEIPVFKNAFELVKVKYGRSGYDDFLSLIKDLLSVDRSNNDAVVAAVITRPPEILLCMKISIPPGDNIFIIFDSHPRPTHSLGSGFILNSSVEATAEYLDGILAIDPRILSDHTMRWQAQLLSQFSGHIIVQKDPSTVSDNVDAILMDVSTTILRLKAELAESQRRESYLSAENEDLQSRLTDLERLQRSADIKGKKKEYNSALNLNESLMSTSGHVSDGKQLQRKGRSLDSENILENAAVATQLQSLYDKEDQDLTAQRSALLVMNQFFECRICFESFARDHVAQFKVCKHPFCRNCLRNYIASTLNERRYPIFCPSCVAENARDAVAVVDDEMFESLGPTTSEIAIFQELQLASYSVILHCRKCGETMFVDRGEYQMSTLIVCPLPRCNHTWCKSCQQAIDIGGPQHSCDGSSELEHLMKKSGWRHCPGCQTPFQKESGCNHMTCLSPGCNTHFCYVCGELITQSLVRGQIRTTISAHYRKCRLFEDVAGR